MASWVLSAIDAIPRIWNRAIVSPARRAAMGACGKGTRIGRRCDFQGIQNVYLGDHCQIGYGSTIWTTRARVVFGREVICGPGLTIITGDHRTDIVGRTMASINDTEKRVEDDQDVLVGNDVWIGANVTILKGVHIGTGSVVAAGSVVTKTIGSYEIWGGVPARKLKMRFSNGDITLHERAIVKEEGLISD